LIINNSAVGRTLHKFPFALIIDQKVKKQNARQAMVMMVVVVLEQQQQHNYH
jgi:hypothetical protein